MEFNKSKMTLGEIISKSFKLVTDNALEILKVIGIFLVPSTIVMFLAMIVFTFSLVGDIDSGIHMSNITESAELGLIISKIIVQIGGFILVMLLISLIYYFGYAVIIKLLGDQYTEEYVNWKQAVKYIWEKKWSLVGMNLLIYFIFVVVYFIAIMLMIFSVNAISEFIFIIIIPIVIVMALVVPSIMMLFNSMLITRNLRAMDAIKKTLRLFSRGRFWSTIGKCAGLGFLAAIVGIFMMLLMIIPLVGSIAFLIGQVYIQSVLMSACNIIVIEDMEYNNDFSEGNFID